MRYTTRPALRSHAVIVIALLAILAGAPEAGARAKKAPRCPTMTEPLAKTLFDDWNKALQAPNHDPSRVVQLYAANAVLLPTKENGPLIGHAQIRGYFAKFLEQDPVGHIDSRAIVPAPCNIGVVAGLYTFKLTENRVRVDVPARYTYVYVYQGGHWLIAHHHSSAQPKKGEEP